MQMPAAQLCKAGILLLKKQKHKEKLLKLFDYTIAFKKYICHQVGIYDDHLWTETAKTSPRLGIRSFDLSEMSDSLTSLTKKEEMSKNKRCTNFFDFFFKTFNKT